MIQKRPHRFVYRSVDPSSQPGLCSTDKNTNQHIATAHTQTFIMWVSILLNFITRIVLRWYVAKFPVPINSCSIWGAQSLDYRSICVYTYMCIHTCMYMFICEEWNSKYHTWRQAHLPSLFSSLLLYYKLLGSICNYFIFSTPPFIPMMREGIVLVHLGQEGNNQ